MAVRRLYVSALTIRQSDGERMLHSSEAVSERTERSVYVSSLSVRGWLDKLTSVGQPVISDDSQRHVDEVHEEMTMVVDTNAVVHPRAVTIPS